MAKAELNIGYSPLTKRIHIAKFKKLSNFTVIKVGGIDPIDVTNTALQCAYQLVIDEGGLITWELDNGDVMKLSAELVNADEIIGKENGK